MNSQTLNAKALGLAFLLYLALTIVLAIGLTLVWQMGLDGGQYTHQQLNALANESPFITIGSALIGSGVGVFCAYFVTARTGRAGYKHALYFAIGLILYGAVSIVAHPEHQLLQQIGKIIAPIPLSLLGAWFAISRTNSKQMGGAQPIKS